MVFAKLRGRLVEMGFTYNDAAEYMGISEKTFFSKINGRVDWKREEIEQLCNLLEIPLTDIHNFFYNSTTDR